MAGPYRKSLDDPDESADYDGSIEDVVTIGDFTVGRIVQLPGFGWRTHIQPLVGGEWCLARHVGVILSGRMRALLEDGTTIDFKANDVFEIPPGHDAWVEGEEPCVSLEWSGLEAWTGSRMRLRDRVLAGLLMSDIVDSTSEANRLGDAGWRRLLAEHHEALRGQLGRFGGREIDTAGDGMFALFDGAARALECAGGFQDLARRQGLAIRVGVHVGEVEVSTQGARGIAVHETARIAAAATPGEIWLSETTRALTGGSSLAFEDRGEHELKGIEGRRRLYAYRPAVG